MKKIYTFLAIISLFLVAKGQTADYELLGFADENGLQTSSIVMNSTQDLKPRVILKNNGPSLASLTDSLIFDIFYNESNYVTSMVVMGSQVHQVTAGEQAIIDLAQPIWTAAIMDQYDLIACTICYELRLVGAVTDPNPNNNRACIPVTRALDIDEAGSFSASLFPNPASSTITLSGVQGSSMQIFDLTGKMMLSLQNIAENQKIDVSSFAEGLYMVRISDGKNILTKKLNVVR
jgi:hypothetical protein